MNARRTTALVGGLLAAGALALAGPSQAAPQCEGGATAPAKEALHGLEGPVAGTPGETVLHTVECALP